MYHNHMGPGYNPMGAVQPAARAGRSRKSSRARGCSTAVLIATPFLLAILAVSAFWVGIPSWHVRTAGVQTQGIAILVADCGRSTDGHGNPGPETYRAVIEFTDQHGQVQHVESHWNCSNFYQDGEQVPLWYLPDDPSSFLTAGEAAWLYILTPVWGGMALFLVIALPVAVAILLRARWQIAQQPEVWG